MHNGQEPAVGGAVTVVTAPPNDDGDTKAASTSMFAERMFRIQFKASLLAREQTEPKLRTWLRHPVDKTTCDLLEVAEKLEKLRIEQSKARLEKKKSKDAAALAESSLERNKTIKKGHPVSTGRHKERTVDAQLSKATDSTLNREGYATKEIARQRKKAASSTKKRDKERATRKEKESPLHRSEKKDKEHVKKTKRSSAATTTLLVTALSNGSSSKVRNGKRKLAREEKRERNKPTIVRVEQPDYAMQEVEDGVDDQSEISMLSEVEVAEQSCIEEGDDISCESDITETASSASYTPSTIAEVPQLPQEIVARILSFLSMRERTAFRQVNKTWLRLVTEINHMDPTQEIPQNRKRSGIHQRSSSAPVFSVCPPPVLGHMKSASLISTSLESAPTLRVPKNDKLTVWAFSSGIAERNLAVEARKAAEDAKVALCTGRIGFFPSREFALPKALYKKPHSTANKNVRWEVKCLVLGDAGCGASSILKCISEGTGSASSSTKASQRSNSENAGFRVVQAEYRKVFFTLWDVCHAESYRHIWPQFYDGVQLLVWVVDSTSDKPKLQTSRELLNEVVAHHYFQANPYIPLLVLATKQDLPSARPVSHLVSDLQLSSLDRVWWLQPCDNCSGKGIWEGLDAGICMLLAR